MLVCTRRTLALLAFAFQSHSCLAQSLATPGQFNVTPGGAAQYSVPIDVPAGTGGMQPHLAVNYDSRAGNGALGVGWNLSGLSRITRCARTMAQDGIRQAIKYTFDDGYCLDGERLIPVAGTNGMDGTEYRTERDSFTKIISTGYYYTHGASVPVSGGPIAFTVWTKSGQTMEFGTSNDSQVRKPCGGYLTTGMSDAQNPIREWALHKVADRAGNYMTVSYKNTSIANSSLSCNSMVDDGVFYPTRVDYTGNAAASMPTSTYALFNWEGRVDRPIPYAGGYPVPHAEMRLTRVDLYVGKTATNKGTKAWYYNLNVDYTRDNLYLPTQVISVEKCEAIYGQCLPATNFVWDQTPIVTPPGGDPSFLPFQFWTSSSAFPGAQSDYQPFFVDMNGDGKKYWVQVSQSSDDAWVGAAKRDGTFAAGDWTKIAQSVGSLDNYQHYFADVDGDGKADWIRVSRTTNEAWVALGTGNGNFQFWSKYTQAVGAANNYNHFFADLDGDGKADWIQISRTTNTSSIGFSTGNGNFQFWTKNLAQFGAAAWDSYFVDIDGDGKADWLAVDRSTGGGVANLSLGNGTFSGAMGFDTLGVGTKYYLSDVNGDGNTDVVGVVTSYIGTSPVYSVSYALSKGDGAFAPWVSAGNSYGIDLFADFNGDGIAGYLTCGQPDAGIICFLRPMIANGGPTQSIAVSSAVPANSNGGFDIQVADLNGDGKADFILIDRTTKKAWVANSQLVTGGKIVSVSTPQQVPTQIAYKALSDTSVYTPDTDAVYPLRNTAFPALGLPRMQNVVSSVVTSNGIGGTVTTKYSYGGQKTDLARRQVLGFRWVQSVQAETGIVSRTDYRLDWPYSGLPSSSQRTLQAAGNNGLLARTTYTYGCNDFVTTGGCTVAPGKRYFPFTTQSVSSSWDLNGAVLPVTTTSYQFDTFGNPTQVVTSTSDGHSSTTTTAYSNDATKWWIGMPTRTSVVNTAP
jgi:hypothetical protein